ncbi:MAG: YceI family protein [Cyclobacteriaceae bacterium]
MRSFFTSTLLACFFFITVNGYGQPILTNVDFGHPTSWKVEKSSYLKINGATNINRFHCSFDSPTLSDTLSLNLNYDKTTVFFINKDITIPIASFDCQNNFITKDFRKTLKAEQHPTINLSFQSINLTPDLGLKTADGIIKISIAGKTKSYNITYSMSSDEQGQWTLKGKQGLQLQDFNITPPQKLLKLIRVKDHISVLFSLKLKQIPCDCPSQNHL